MSLLGGAARGEEGAARGALKQDRSALSSAWCEAEWARELGPEARRAEPARAGMGRARQAGWGRRTAAGAARAAAAGHRVWRVRPNWV